MSKHLTIIPEISLSEVNGEPRARDLDIAQRLGFGRDRDIRPLIERNLAELETFGVCAIVSQNHGGGRGRPAKDLFMKLSPEGKKAALAVARWLIEDRRPETDPRKLDPYWQDSPDCLAVKVSGKAS